MKFKVIELDWYGQFNSWCSFLHPSQLSEQEIHDKELVKYNKEGMDYDGPFRYIEPCDDPGFPPREKLKYCVRLPDKPKDIFYRAYQCYCFQLGKWWKFKGVEYMFTEIHIPQLMSWYDYGKLKCPWRFLSEEAKKDRYYYNRIRELDNISRSIGKNFLRIKTRI
jgi:hypothetical protein